MFCTVTEKWDYDHTNEFRIKLHYKLDEMQEQGKFVFNDINNYRSVYNEKGSPTKVFTSLAAAKEYIAWIKKYETPTEMQINEFLTKEDLNNFLRSIMCENFEGHAGPTEEEHAEYAKKHNL